MQIKNFNKYTPIIFSLFVSINTSCGNLSTSEVMVKGGAKIEYHYGDDESFDSSCIDRKAETFSKFFRVKKVNNGYHFSTEMIGITLARNTKSVSVESTEVFDTNVKAVGVVALIFDKVVVECVAPR